MLADCVLLLTYLVGFSIAGILWLVYSYDKLRNDITNISERVLCLEDSMYREESDEDDDEDDEKDNITRRLSEHLEIRGNKIKMIDELRSLNNRDNDVVDLDNDGVEESRSFWGTYFGKKDN